MLAPNIRKYVFPALILFFVCGAFSLFLAADANFGAGDLRTYWLGTQILRAGGNPYDGLIWRAAHFPGGPGISGDKLDMLWNPPIVFGLLLPIVSDVFEQTRLIFIFLNLAAYSACFGICLWSWKRHSDIWPIGFVLALAFIPFWLTLELGQLSIFVLLFLLLSLVCANRGAWFLSGVVLAPAMIKPHIGFLLTFAIFLASVPERRWHFIVGALLGGAVLLIFPLTANPSAIHDWLSMRDWASRNRSNTAASWMRVCFSTEAAPFPVWPSYLMPVIGVLLTPIVLKRFEGCFFRAAPILLVLSFITAPYGYVFDAVILLPGMLSLIGQSRMSSPILILANIAFGLLFLNAANPEDYAKALLAISITIFALGWGARGGARQHSVSAQEG